MGFQPSQNVIVRPWVYTFWNYWQFYNIATMIICWLKKTHYKMWKCLQCSLWLLFIPYLFLLQCLIYILHWLWIVLKIVFCPWYRLHFDNFFHSFVFALLCYFSLKKFFVILWVYHIGIVWPAGKIKQIFSLRYPTFF